MTRTKFISIVAVATTIVALIIIFAIRSTEKKDIHMDEDCPEKALNEYYSELISKKIATSGDYSAELADIASNLIEVKVNARKKTREGCELTFVLTLGNIHGLEQPELTKTKKAEMIQEGEIWRVKNITDI